MYQMLIRLASIDIPSKVEFASRGLRNLPGPIDYSQANWCHIEEVSA